MKVKLNFNVVFLCFYNAFLPSPLPSPPPPPQDGEPSLLLTVRSGRRHQWDDTDAESSTKMRNAFRRNCPTLIALDLVVSPLGGSFDLGALIRPIVVVVMMVMVVVIVTVVSDDGGRSGSGRWLLLAWLLRLLPVATAAAVVVGTLHCRLQCDKKLKNNTCKLINLTPR